MNKKLDKLQIALILMYAGFVFIGLTQVSSTILAGAIVGIIVYIILR